MALVARVLYRKIRIRYRQNTSVVDMDRIDGSVVLQRSNRVAIGSVDTIVTTAGEETNDNTFYRRAYDDLGEVF